MLSKRLLVLTGKGGVGKSVLCGAIGKAAASLGRKVMLTEVRSLRRLPSLFGLDVTDDGPLNIGTNLEWINLTPEHALEVYALRLLKLRTVYKAVFEQRAVRKFLRVVPSLAEILMLGHVVDMIEHDEADLFVLDAPSTGPGALMLQAPGAVMETAPPGPLRQGAQWIHSLLSDRQACAVSLVVLAEELPVSEAIELYHVLRDKVDVPMGVSFANRIFPEPQEWPKPDILDHILTLKNCSPLKDVWRSYSARLALQGRYLDKLEAGVDLPMVKLPEVLESDNGMDVVNSLAIELGKMMGGEG